MLSAACCGVLLIALAAVPVGRAGASAAENEATAFDSIEGRDPIDMPLDAAGAEEALERMDRIEENSRFVLYLDKTYLTVALVSKEDGQILFSNPWSLEGRSVSSDEIREELYSQLELVYFNKKYESFTLNSWDDCVSKGQFALRDIENGVAVDMILGELTGRILVPRLIPAQSFEAMVEKIPEDSRKKVSRMYKLYSKESAANENQLQDWLKMYPVLEEMDLYALKESSTREMKMAEKLIKDTGYSFEDLERDHAAAGYEGEDTAMASFRVTMRYTLTDSGLEVDIPAEGISFDTDYFYLNEITPLKYFGAGFSMDEEGYLLFPDGCGALVRYTGQSERSTSKLTMKYYGRDFTDGESAVYVPRQTEVRLPVFGNSNASSAFVAAVGEGAAMGKVTAQAGTNANPLNTIYTTFTYSDKLQYVLDVYKRQVSSTSTGLLPPSSSVTGVKCSAAARMTLFPTPTLPVKKIWSNRSRSKAALTSRPP